MKALIAYGTRYGATTSTADFIANILREEGFETKVVNLKEEKIDNIDDYSLVIVASGMQVDRWTSDPEHFLDKHKKELATKKVALFVSSGAIAIIENEHNIKAAEREWKKYLEEKAEKFHLKPLALGLFGGVWDYDKMGSITRKLMENGKLKLEAAGFKAIRPGFYDTRDWNEIKTWTQQLVKEAAKEKSTGQNLPITNKK